MEILLSILASIILLAVTWVVVTWSASQSSIFIAETTQQVFDIWKAIRYHKDILKIPDNYDDE